MGFSANTSLTPPEGSSTDPGDSYNWNTGHQLLDTILNTVAPMDPNSAMMNLMPMGAVVGKGAKAALGPIEQLIMDQAAKGSTLSRGLVRPMLTHAPTGTSVIGGIGGSHGDLYGQIMQRLRGAWKPGEMIHQFATPEGHAISPNIFSLLSSNPEQIQRGADLIGQGKPLGLLEEILGYGAAAGR